MHRRRCLAETTPFSPCTGPAREHATRMVQELELSRSRVGLSLPSEPASADGTLDKINAQMPYEGSADNFRRAVGGIKVGYQGHVPRAQTHFASSHFGQVAESEKRGWTAQRGHTAIAAEKSIDRSPNEPSRRAAYSLPGYAGHRRGNDGSFGSSFWHDTAVAPPRQTPPRKDCRQWRMTPSTPRQTHTGAHARVANTRTTAHHPTPARSDAYVLTPRQTHPIAAHAQAGSTPPPAGLPPRPIEQSGATVPSATPASASTPAVTASSAATAAPVSSNPVPRPPTHRSEPPSARNQTWTLNSETHGKPAEEPGTIPTHKRREMISVTSLRDPDEVALKPKFVRRIVSGLSGPADTWVPPAG
jgi:hypothetical protein